LYHGTLLQNAIRIIASNEFYSGIDWRGEGDRVSLTRSYNVASDFSGYEGICGETTGVVFVLDPVKLAHNHKIKPYRDVDSSGQAHEENEEMVMGNIKPAEPFIISINIPVETMTLINSNTFDEIKECWIEETHFSSVEEIDNQLHRLLTHPKVNRSK
jgi:hypothetical protein